MLASFHLVRYPAGPAAREALSRMGLDRPLLSRTPGLRFWRLLGTGAGERLSLSADLRRWALLALWEDRAAYDAFLAENEIPARWSQLAEEQYHLLMRPVRAQGRWGRAQFDVRGGRPAPDEPIAILTRAAIRPTKLLPFWRAVPAPAIGASGHPALRASVGIGDWPLVRQATFSVWDSLEGAQDYAYRRPEHRAVIERRREERWYSSELFARFVPLEGSGSWNGSDPLAR